MNRADLHSLVAERLLDVRALLDGQRWAFAYYNAGYVVECALKSCVLSRMAETGWVLREKDVDKQDDPRTHDFKLLIKIAGLTDLLNGKLKADAAAGGQFGVNWKKVSEWRETSRYQPHDESAARSLYAAIIDVPDGVLPWLRTFW